jgi:gluconate 2-dehydrogenase subunit 3-like protein
MPDPRTLETLRVAIDTVVPTTDGMPGAIELNAHQHVVDMLELNLPGITDMVAALLDAYAGEVSPGTPFKDLGVDDRGTVFRAMSTDESQDIRDAIDALIVFGCGGTFSEWSGYDRAAKALKAPPTWSAVGYHGPSHGHADYRPEVGGPI